jgi:hypothetical protein
MSSEYKLVEEYNFLNNNTSELITKVLQIREKSVTE